VRYVGKREGGFTGSAVRQIFPAYAQADLRAGVKHDPWSINVFVTNLTDKRGLLAGGIGEGPYPTYFSYIQPRTVGLSLSRTF